MTAKTRQKLMYGVLILAVCWGAYNLIGEPQPKADLPNLEPAAASTAANPARVLPIPEAFIDVEACQALKWGGDPFRAEYSTTRTVRPDAPVWNLAGIVFSETNPMAIVNSRMVSPGDRIDGATVKSIGRQVVTIEYNGSTLELRVNKG